MSHFSRNKLKYRVDENFFASWTAQMAYILGFAYADGNIHRTSLSWDIQKKDKNILVKINAALESNYPISLQRKSSYRLRINNQNLVNGAKKLGLFPKKIFRDILPRIPKKLLRHFLRGYLEGDGWLVIRRQNEFDLGFSNGNREFLENVNKIIATNLGVSPTKVRERVKITPKGTRSISYMMEFYSSKAIKIARCLYGDLGQADLSLDRKYKIFARANKLYTYLESGTKKVRIVQRKVGKPIKDILQRLYVEKNLNGLQIANRLEVHFSSIYRWLHRLQIPIREN